MTMTELMEYAKFNREFADAVHAGKKAGRSVEEMAKSWTQPAKFTGYAEPQPARVTSNIQVISDEIK